METLKELAEVLTVLNSNHYRATVAQIERIERIAARAIRTADAIGTTDAHDLSFEVQRARDDMRHGRGRFEVQRDEIFRLSSMISELR